MLLVKTKRLHFRPVQLGDEKYTFPEVDEELTRHWIGWEPSQNIEEERRVIGKKVKLGETFPNFEWIAFDNSDNFIGCCGISPSEEKGEFEINLWIKHSEQGKGYGKEMCDAVLDQVNKNTNLDYLVYSVTEGNEASSAIVRKMNSSLIRKLVYPKRDILKAVTDYKIPVR